MTDREMLERLLTAGDGNDTLIFAKARVAAKAHLAESAGQAPATENPAVKRWREVDPADQRFVIAEVRSHVHECDKAAADVLEALAERSPS